MFAVVMVTVRPKLKVAPTIARIWETATEPLDLFVLDGSEGKSAALNGIREVISQRIQYQYVVTLDDDIWLPPDWQRDCIEALSFDYGGVGLDLSHTIEGYSLMVEVHRADRYEINGRALFVRPAPRVNLAGIFICMRHSDHQQIPPYPSDGKTKYDFDEDHFRCLHLKRRGLRLGYVCCRGGGGDPRIVNYQDPPGYVAAKRLDTEYIRNVRGIAK